MLPPMTALQRPNASPSAAPSFSAPAPAPPSVIGGGLFRVVKPENVQQVLDAGKTSQVFQQQPEEIALVSHIRSRMTEMRNFRNTEGIAERLLNGLRTYKGMYDAQKLSEIRQFGGSEVYARVAASKCRGATALLRDVFLGPERPWDIAPSPVPEIPNSIDESIQQLVSVEVATNQANGVQIDQQMIADRVAMLRKAAEQAAKKQAKDECDRASDKVDDILREGQFYDAFAEFLIDLPIFPYAVIKGPVVRRTPQLKWEGGNATSALVPKMYWYRVSPFDMYWTPGASHTEEAEFVERIRLSRAELQSVRGLPGYNNEAIDEVLKNFSSQGYRDWWDATDQERARLESRENWPRTSANLLDTAEFHGNVSGQMLLEWGMPVEKVPDPLIEYRVTAWLIDRYVIKAQIKPTPQQRHPYYISNFEKVPGSIIGNGLPDLLDDIQSVSCATLRALVNNLSISSGPQVVINDAVIQPGDNDQLYPWKRWHVNFDPMIAGTSKPIDFYQPNSNAEVLLGVFEKFGAMADEVSAIPRYMTGSEKVGGAGRTASGLAMLMGNAAKTLQNVAASIDRDVTGPLLKELYDMIMLTMPGIFRGDEQIVVKGVNYAVKREQDRMRQLEFLQITANPIDQAIMGMPGRATVLRSVSENLGLEHERVVPDEATIKAQMQAAASMQMGAPPGAPQSAQPPGGSPPALGPNRAGPEKAREQVEGQMTNNATGRPGMRAGG